MIGHNDPLAPRNGGENIMHPILVIIILIPILLILAVFTMALFPPE